MSDRGRLELKTQVIKDLEAENEQLRSRIRELNQYIKILIQERRGALGTKLSGS